MEFDTLIDTIMRKFFEKNVMINGTNGFFQSTNTSPLCCPLSLFTDHLFVVSSNVVTVLCNARNPDGLSFSRFQNFVK